MEEGDPALFDKNFSAAKYKTTGTIALSAERLWSVFDEHFDDVSVADCERDCRPCGGRGFGSARDRQDYVKDELSGVRHGDQIERLQELRTWADAIKAATTEELKKSIFAKYHQFMESSKEVAHLEHEMHQLSSLLAAQKTLIENLREMCGDHR
ncbi:hypothetical protein QR680_007835 [Steinernema hermaphroditum]|uniref:Uncharacterized protein n=1 Tax=Steinernema hermaphroditum TaxID=289476 RepID=A0AA39M6R9_9BILA|nr:hypothetical protein QR680_007835 [Steinernema hermaphroditum]